jgi:hypothetical protein
MTFRRPLIAAAVNYIRIEGGGPGPVVHQPHPPRPSCRRTSAHGEPNAMPGCTSPRRAQRLQANLVRTALERTHHAWLSYAMLGCWTELGRGLPATHHYRVQPFPPFLYYLTYSHPPLGAAACSLSGGLCILALAVTSFYRSFHTKATPADSAAARTFLYIPRPSRSLVPWRGSSRLTRYHALSQVTALMSALPSTAAPSQPPKSRARIPSQDEVSQSIRR